MVSVLDYQLHPEGNTTADYHYPIEKFVPEMLFYKTLDFHRGGYGEKNRASTA